MRLLFHSNSFARVAILLTSLGNWSCKPSSGGGTDAGSGISSVAVQLPSSVKGVNVAELRSNTGAFSGRARDFSVQIQTSSSNGGGSTITFARDTQNEGLKVGDDLGTVELVLLAGKTEVYKGTGSQTPFIIRQGNNNIDFNLNCVNQSLCPVGSSMQVIKVPGATASDGQTPQIVANISVSERNGMTISQQRDLMSQCQEQVRVKSCDQWGVTISQGATYCQKVLEQKSDEICEGNATFRGYCLGDILDLCKKLGVITGG